MQKWMECLLKSALRHCALEAQKVRPSVKRRRLIVLKQQERRACWTDEDCRKTDLTLWVASSHEGPGMLRWRGWKLQDSGDCGEYPSQRQPPAEVATDGRATTESFAWYLQDNEC